MESIPFIAWCLEHLNYFTITLLMAIESSFIPFPSEIVIPPAAYLAASTGEMSVVGIFFFGTLGALIGASVNYFLARWLGRPAQPYGLPLQHGDRAYHHRCGGDRTRGDDVPGTPA